MLDDAQLGRDDQRQRAVGQASLRQAVVPAFPRRSPLIDYIHGVGEKAGDGAHPASDPLTAEERELFTLWVLLGAQYR